MTTRSRVVGAMVSGLFLGATPACDVVFGIESYGPGPTVEAGSPEDVVVDAGHDAGLRDTGGGALDVQVDTHVSACTVGQTQCSGNGVETCRSSGTWSAPVACSGADPYCYAGKCVNKPASCAPGGKGMTNCGAGLESCCTSHDVEGGTYSRIYSNTGSGPTGEADPATVSTLQLDKYLVTVGRFRQFVNAWNGGAGFLPAAGSGKHTHLNGGSGLENSGPGGSFETGWVESDDGNIDPTPSELACSVNATFTFAPGSNESLPINCINWYEAYAFCIFDSAFLPSEAEWEYVAAGGSAMLEYPWGSMAPGTADKYAIYGCDYPPGADGTCQGVKSIAPVGTATLGAGTWGQLDMAGNVLEWMVDWEANYTATCDDCAYLGSTSGRVVRGGDYQKTASSLLPPARVELTPAARNDGVGIRCARAP